MHAMQKWSLALLLTILAVVVSYVWLDRPIAVFVHGRMARFDLFAKVTHIPALIAPLVILAFAAVALWVLSDQRLPKLQTVAMLAAASLAVADAVKDQLKFAFGRTWPETWVRNNPSFIHDGVFGFYPFHGGPGFAAFPSGHATAVCAVMSVLWLCYPRFRVFYAAAIAAVAVALIGADFHFLGDVIAGGFLGITTGWLTVVLWERGRREVRGDAPPQPKPPS
jgi:membrane-associated phospholipid phosphatase